MFTRPTLSALAAAVLVGAAFVGAAPRLAAAQTAASCACDAPWPAPPSRPGRLLAAYDFTVGGFDLRVPLPVRVELADSGGALAARYWTAGERAARPMSVTVQGVDVVLRADTPQGPLRLVLTRENDPPTDGTLSGRWRLGDARGELRGRRRMFTTHGEGG